MVVAVTEPADGIAVVVTVANPVVGRIDVTEPADTFEAYDTNAPVEWDAWCEIITLDSVADIRAEIPLLGEAYSAYDDIVEFEIEYQLVTTDDPETDPSPWQVLKAVLPTR